MKKQKQEFIKLKLDEIYSISFVMDSIARNKELQKIYKEHFQRIGDFIREEVKGIKKILDDEVG